MSTAIAIFMLGGAVFGYVAYAHLLVAKWREGQQSQGPHHE